MTRVTRVTVVTVVAAECEVVAAERISPATTAASSTTAVVGAETIDEDEAAAAAAAAVVSRQKLQYKMTKYASKAAQAEERAGHVDREYEAKLIHYCE